LYNRTYWQDHIVDEATGEVLVEGTLQDAEHFNNMEEGIFGAMELAASNAEALGKQQRSVASLEGELIQVALTNSMQYPFNNSIRTISLTNKKTTKNYKIHTEVVSSVGGGVGDIVITDKLLNGFKVEYTGAATEVVINLFISGGE